MTLTQSWPACHFDKEYFARHILLTQELTITWTPDIATSSHPSYAMDSLSVAASIAGRLTIADAVFRGAYKYCKAASDASNEIKEIINRLRSFSGLLHSLKIHADVLRQDGTLSAFKSGHILDAKKLLVDMQSRLAGAQAKMDGPKHAKISQALKWPFTKTKTKEFTEKLTQLHEIIGLALQADSLSQLSELLGNSNHIKSQLSSLQQDVSNLQMLTKVKIDDERLRILDFFLKVNPQPNLTTSIKLKHDGTCTWLMNHHIFQDWISTPGSKLWLSGIPGAGKTVLAGAIIQAAFSKATSSPNVGVAFFFCDYKDAKSLLLYNLLGAMASQLGRQNDQAFAELKKVFEGLNPPNGLSQELDSEALINCLSNISAHFDQIILVVDGLDECGTDTDEVTQALVDIHNYSSNITMALASRDEHNIRFRLDGIFERIEVSAQKNDLSLYVASELAKRIDDKRLYIVDMELKDEILNKLSNEAEGSGGLPASSTICVIVSAMPTAERH
ncbi:hypothetical protein F4808DRAFT_286564 [Astrocystis sublimbata]|nr:hypothetical protein F4808DRAFT_286564 [Astrocystis sublimbata]